MMNNAIINVYIDANVLINYCTGKGLGKEGLSYVFKKFKRNHLFTSSLAMVQTIAELQKKKKERDAFSKKQTIEFIKKLSSKITVVDFTFNQIEKAFSYDSNDIEDNIQYQISQINNCDAILTNNLKDFRIFKDVEKLLPEVHFLRTKLEK